MEFVMYPVLSRFWGLFWKLSIGVFLGGTASLGISESDRSAA